MDKKVVNFFFVLSIAVISLCGCSHKDAEEKINSVESGYIGNNYTAEYSIPSDIDVSFLEPDIELSGISCNNELESDMFISNVISISDSEYLAYYYSFDDKASGYGLAFYNAETETLGDRITNIPGDLSGIGKILDEPGHFFVYSATQLYVYDLNSGNYEGVLWWDTYNIAGFEVKSVFGNEKNIVAKLESASGEEIIMFSPSGNNSTGDNNKNYDDKNLIIATTNVSNHLRAAVNEYNKNDPEYQIEIVDYSKMALDRDDADSRLTLSFLSDSPPDIVDLTSMGDFFSDFVNQKYITGLDSYIAGSAKVNTDDYYDKILELFKAGNEIYAIPYAYSLITFWIDDDIISGSGWSIKDMEDFCARYPEAYLAMENTKSYALFLCLYGNIDYFVDKVNGKSNFDCDEFRDILLFANKFPEKSNYVELPGASYREELKSKHLLTKYIYFDKIEGIQRISGNSHLVGFPSIDGKPIVYIKPSLNTASLAICEKSNKKDAAWDFIEYYLERPVYKANKNDTDVYGIPSKEKIFMSRVKEISDEDGLFARTIVNETPNHALTEEELEAFYALREIARPEPYDNTYIREIVEEESSAYFAGEKDIEDVINIIQSRVQLYLDENR